MSRTTLILADHRLTEIKRLAADRGKTISAVVDEFLAEGLQRAHAPKRRTVTLPTFNMGEARVNVADRDQLQEFLEHE
jgi:hypothetical protein